MSELTSNVCNIYNCSNVDASLSSFILNIENIGKPLFKKSNTMSFDKTKGDNFVFDQECKDKRKIFYHLLNKFRKDKSQDNKNAMITARSEYKKELRSFNYRKGIERTNKLVNVKLKDAKQYWKLLKDSTTQNNPKNITSNSFSEYFKAINNPDDSVFQPDEDILYFNDRFLNSEVQVMFDELNVPITESELRFNVKQLGLGRSGGPDKVLN